LPSFARYAMMLGVAGSDTPKNSDETEALLGGRGYHWPVSPVTEGGFSLEAKMNSKVKEQKDWVESIDPSTRLSREVVVLCCYYWIDDDRGIVVVDNHGFFHKKEKLKRLRDVIDTTLALTDEEVLALDSETEAELYKTQPIPERKQVDPIAKDGYVYLIKTGPLHKIGVSRKNPDKRLHNYHTENPFPVEILACVRCNDYLGVEVKILDAFKAAVSKGNEWLDLTEQDVEQIVSLIKENEVHG